jgi:hypothetical protein
LIQTKNLAQRKRRRRIEDACASPQQSDKSLEAQQLSQNERASAFQLNHDTISTLETPPAQAMIQTHESQEAQKIERRKREDFQHIQSTANNIYFRNSIHVLESIKQLDSILG